MNVGDVTPDEPWPDRMESVELPVGQWPRYALIDEVVRLREELAQRKCAQHPDATASWFADDECWRCDTCGAPLGDEDKG